MIAEIAIMARLLQVYDLQEYRPAPVLKKIWKNFEAQERNGDTWAPIVRGWVQPFVSLPELSCCITQGTRQEYSWQEHPPVTI